MTTTAIRVVCEECRRRLSQQEERQSREQGEFLCSICVKAGVGDILRDDDYCDSDL